MTDNKKSSSGEIFFEVVKYTLVAVSTYLVTRYMNETLPQPPQKVAVVSLPPIISNPPSPVETQTVPLPRSKEPLIEKEVESPVSIPSPREAVKNYFSYINNHQYSTAWDNLSYNFQSNKRLHEHGYNTFENFWQKFNLVELKEIVLLERTAETSLVKVNLKYFGKNGKSFSGSYKIYFIWDDSNNRWLIEETF